MRESKLRNAAKERDGSTANHRNRLPKFLAILRDATNSKKKIDISYKEQWNRFVREHNVPEAGMAVKAKAGAMSGKTKAVILEGNGEADGYYVYSPDDLFCLKYDLGL